MIGKNLLARRGKLWKHVLVKLGDDVIVKCKYCSAKFTESKQKQLTILSNSQKIDLAEVVLARLLAEDSLPMRKFGRSKESQNGWVSRTQDSNRKKSHKTDVSIVHGQNQSKLETKIGFTNKQQTIDCLICTLSSHK